MLSLLSFLVCLEPKPLINDFTSSCVNITYKVPQFVQLSGAQTGYVPYFKNSYLRI